MGEETCGFIYQIVKKIPEGKVATYGQIAQLTNNSLLRQDFGWQVKLKAENRKVTPRLVGLVLHRNPNPKNVPCHRVADKNGKLAKNYAFGGWRGQKRRLEEEGVKFKDQLHVYLKDCLWEGIGVCVT